MRIAGTGIDLADVARVGAAVARHGARFVDRVFTADEAAYCRSCPVPARHFAARFAAKEAVFKALGTGWSLGIRWRDIEVTRDPSGTPRIRLLGRAAEQAREAGIVHVHVSISHTDTLAVACALAEAEDS